MKITNENFICKETIFVLNNNQEEKKLIPIDIVNQIKQKANLAKEHLRFDKNNKIILSRDTKLFITYLYQKYIVQSDDVKNILLNQKLEENKKIKEIIMQNRNKKIIFLDQEEMFRKKENKVTLEQNKSLVVIKETFFDKIINKIKKFLIRNG